MLNKQTKHLKMLLEQDRMSMGQHERSKKYNKQNVLNIIDYIKENINMIEFNNFNKINLGVVSINTINNSIFDELIHYLGEGYTYDLGIPVEIRNCWEEIVLIPSVKEIFKYSYSINLLNNINWTDSTHDINHNDNPKEQSRGAYQTFGSLIFNGYFNTINEVLIQIIKCENTDEKLVLPVKFPFQLLWSGFRYFPNEYILNTIFNIFKNLNICIKKNKIFINNDITFEYNDTHNPSKELISSFKLLIWTSIRNYQDIPLYAPDIESFIIKDNNLIDITDTGHKNLLESYETLFLNINSYIFKNSEDRMFAIKTLYSRIHKKNLFDELSTIKPVYVSHICDVSHLSVNENY